MSRVYFDQVSSIDRLVIRTRRIDPSPAPKISIDWVRVQKYSINRVRVQKILDPTGSTGDTVHAMRSRESRVLPDPKKKDEPQLPIADMSHIFN
jgi:hypothetical protein